MAALPEKATETRFILLSAPDVQSGTAAENYGEHLTVAPDPNVKAVSHSHDPASPKPEPDIKSEPEEDEKPRTAEIPHGGHSSSHMTVNGGQPGTSRHASQTASPKLSSPPETLQPPKPGPDGSTPGLSASTTVDSLPVRHSLSEEKSLAESKPHTEDSMLASLETLVANGSPKQVEAGVKKAAAYLQLLGSRLNVAKPNADTRKWLQAIDDVRAKLIKTKTVLGVVGSTGAGKSSLINAVLDEDNLVSTNCMRACTAVVTEISWNEVDLPDQRYRAEIDFISREDWLRELNLLFEELLDSNQKLNSDYLNPDTEAGVAYAKIRAVYPQLTRTKEKLSACTPNELAELQEVREVLGTAKEIRCHDASSFRREIQPYLDSQDASTKKEHRSKKPMAYWPLIKVVRVYVKSQALATGACLVDLPGVGDANAARSAIADRYLANCHGLWIVAPITRAVDDKAAKKLLGASFKLQLKLDGSWANVTFICSKTDDISVSEVANTLDEEGTILASEERDDAISEELSNLREAHRSLNHRKFKVEEQLLEMDSEMEVSDESEDEVHPGSKRSKLSNKRKRQLSDSGEEESSSEISPPEGRENAEGGALAPQARKRRALGDKSLRPVAAEQSGQRRGMKSDGSDTTNAKLQKDFNKLVRDLTKIHERIGSLECERSRSIEDRTHSCIVLRNDKSCEAIRRQFAEGIREIDEDDARNDDDYDPESPTRDYEEVASSLPVFCISSRGYQALRKKSSMDDPVRGYKTLQDTGIPQLQEHARDISADVQAEKNRTFLQDFYQLMRSVMLWVTTDGYHIDKELPSEMKNEELRFFDTVLQILEKDLEDAVESTVRSLKGSMTRTVFGAFQVADMSAAQSAPGIAQEWCAPRQEGGLAFASYRAACRRLGELKTPKHSKDFNEELSLPWKQRLVPAWEAFFDKALPEELRDLPERAGTVLRAFYQKVVNRSALEARRGTSLDLLGQQIELHIRRTKEWTAVLTEIATKIQRESTRLMRPNIKEKMEECYQSCATEKGKGCFVRMKETMETGIGRNSGTMYREGSQKVKVGLQSMTKDLETEAKLKIQEALEQIKTDYLAVIHGCDRDVSEEVKIAQDEIRDTLASMGRDFRMIC